MKNLNLGRPKQDVDIQFLRTYNKFRMEFIKLKKIDLEGKLLVSIPSEGCLGQRVVDQILTNNKCFEFVGSFHHSSLQVILIEMKAILAKTFYK